MESCSGVLEPDSRKKMGCWNPGVLGWNPAVGCWNLIPARKWGAGILGCLVGILQWGAGTRFPQENGVLESWGAWLESCSGVLEPDSLKKMGCWSPGVLGWNPAVGCWSPIPARKWAAGILGCLVGILRWGAGTRLPQENGALESWGAWLESCSGVLEPDSRKKMGCWSPGVLGWNPAVGCWNPIPARKWGAGILGCLAGILQWDAGT